MTESNQNRLLPVQKVNGKYYTRLRWGNKNTGEYAVRFPLNTDNIETAKHRRDIISYTALRGQIIKAYQEHGSIGVKMIKEQIDWFSRSGSIVENGLTVAQAIKEYEEYCVCQRLSKDTISLYLRSLNEFAKIVRVKHIHNIKKPHFTLFKKKQDLSLSPHTINRKLRSLQTFFNWLFDEGFIEHPVRIKKLTAINRPVNYFSNAEFEIIMQDVEKGFPHGQAKMDDDDRELFISAYQLYRDTGLRLSEPFNNELKIDDSGYRLKIIGSSTKNSYQRFVHLLEQQAMTIIQMNEWLDKQLETRKHRSLAIKVFSRVFKKALSQSRMKGKFHDLRKTFATRFYFLTGQEFSLMYALGHTDTSMTQQYTNLDKVELSRAFPDIVAMKNGVLEGKTPLTVHNQRYIEEYSNFGFIHHKK